MLPRSDGDGDRISFIAQDLQLSPLGMGQVLSAFFVGYALNTAGQVAGVISPLLVGYVLEVTGGNFQIVLFGMVGLALLAILPASRIRHASQPLVTASSAT